MTERVMPMYDEGTNSGFNLLWKDIHILEVENRYTLMAYERPYSSLIKDMRKEKFYRNPRQR